ncbi:MAG: CoA-transferase subunit beta [Anaerolineae bacterium]
MARIAEVPTVAPGVTAYAEDYTPDELMVATLARTIRDGDTVMHGVASMIPVMAIRLAKATHAPNMVCINLEGIDFRPQRCYLTTEYFALGEGAVQWMSLPRLFEHAQRGRVSLGFFSGVQIDREGNINTSALGDYQHPSVRLTGGAGQAILAHTVGRIVMWLPRHERRRLPEKVDFVTFPGHHPNVKKRLDQVVTNLAVMEFDQETGYMRLVSLHPRVTVEQVQQNTGFELLIPSEVPETEPPTVGQIRLLREKIDPEGVRELGM